MKYLKKIFSEKVQEYMYLIAIFIYAMKFAYKNSTLLEADSYQNFLLYSSICVLCLPKIVLQKYNRKELIASVSIFALAVLAYCFNPTRNLLALPFILVGVKDCSMRKIAKIVFAVLLSFVTVHTFGYFYLHFVEGGTLFNIPWFNRGPNRSTVLCKSYNNYGAITSMFTIVYLFLTDRENNKYFKFLTWLLLSVFFYAIGTSRTSLIVSLLSIFFLLIEKTEFINGNIRYIKYFAFAFLILFSVSMFFMDMNNDFVKLLDKLLTTRIYWAVEARKQIGISLLPNVAKLLEHDMFIDNLVVYFVIVYGVILTAVLISMVIYFAIIPKQSFFVDYMLIITFLWAVTERYPTYVLITLIPMLVMHRFYENN